MTLTDLVLVVAGVLAVVDLARSRGQALTSWAVLLVVAVLLWPLVG